MDHLLWQLWCDAEQITESIECKFQIDLHFEHFEIACSNECDCSHNCGECEIDYRLCQMSHCRNLCPFHLFATILDEIMNFKLIWFGSIVCSFSFPTLVSHSSLQIEIFQLTTLLFIFKDILLHCHNKRRVIL